MSLRGVWAVATLLAGLGAGCVSPAEFVNPEFLTALGYSPSVRTVPAEAPGLLVSVENRTGRWAAVTVSYRGGDGAIETYTTRLPAGSRSGQMLLCPVSEITLGSVADLTQAGVIIGLSGDVADVQDIDGLPINTPYVVVEPFGVLLREEVNYDCGDELVFVVEASGQTRSGFQTRALIRRSGTQ